METIAEWLVGFLGWIMLLCYALVKNYGLSIILFTLVTKFLLFPISLMTQKNSIRMVQMQPELDALKIKYIDDKDKLTDGQLALYKKFKYNPFLDTVPLIIQLILVLGLVKVIYRPLSYTLDINSLELNVLKNELIKGDPGNDAHIFIIKQIKNGALANVSDQTINAIKNFDISFLGIDLSLTPSFKTNPILLTVPLLAGLSALIMCLAQNKINVLQMAQTTANKTAATIFMVAFSTYFAFLVPAGVGLYWIFGNLFSIPLMMLTNAVIPPRKYVDYEKLLKTRESKIQIEKENKKYYKRERADYKSFFAVKDMKLMIYSEQNGFYKYYKGMIDYICEHSDIDIHYVTSDPNDNIFNDPRSNIHPYYIARDRFLIPLFMKLDCDMCIMTMPDLEKYHIKRSRVRKNINYVYIVHGMGSVALTLRKGALDWYDTVFSIGVDMTNEVRETEKLYGTRPKTIVEAGYMLLDTMAAKYAKMPAIHNEPKKIMIAPSWQPDNIIDSCCEELLDVLSKSGFDVVLRPHPQMVRHYPEKFELLHEKYDGTNIEVQTDFSQDSPVLTADVLITDWSDIAYEFAFTTRRPVLYINTPMKIMNSEYDKIPTVPINIALRDVIGKSVDMGDIAKVPAVIDELTANADKYKTNIEQVLNERFYNVGKSSIIYGRYVIKTLNK